MANFIVNEMVTLSMWAVLSVTLLFSTKRTVLSAVTSSSIAVVRGHGLDQVVGRSEEGRGGDAGERSIAQNCCV